MSKQLTLGIALRDDATFENFQAGSNAQVIGCLQALAKAQGEQFLYLWGEEGAGVSHLMQACCHEVFNQKQKAIYLPLVDRLLMPEVLHDLEQIDLICLDDVECVMSKPDWEEALLHLYNRVRDGGSRLIIAAKAIPKLIDCQLADLRSRLSWGLALKVEAPSDEIKLTALQMRANQRGLELTRDAGLFLLNTCPRDMSILFSVLDELDRASMVAKKRLTLPFVKRFIESLSS